MIDNSIVKIIRSASKEKKFQRALEKINKLSSKYPVYMGIDFEFNTKKVALMQILFEIHTPKKNISKYYIIYPPNLTTPTNNYLKYSILSNTNIMKIFHGSESLDIPWIVEDYFEYELEPLIDFFLSMVDTRYMCEYLNIISSKPNICRIYDMLLNNNIINQSIKDALDKNEERMGPIYNIFIDINNLTDELITYSIHDVVYLVKAFIDLKKQIIQSNPKDYYLLTDCVRYSFMERRSVTNIGDDLTLINRMNNYFYYIKKSNTNTNEVLNDLLDLMQTEPNLDKPEFYYKISMIKTFELMISNYTESYDVVKNILKINYIKTNILNLLKTLTYIIILRHYKVKASNTEIVDYDLESNYKNITSGIDILGLGYLSQMITKYVEFIENKLKP